MPEHVNMESCQSFPSTIVIEYFSLNVFFIMHNTWGLGGVQYNRQRRTIWWKLKYIVHQLKASIFTLQQFTADGDMKDSLGISPQNDFCHCK